MCIFGNDNCLVVLVDRSVRLAGELLPGLRDLIHLARVPLVEDDKYIFIMIPPLLYSCSQGRYSARFDVAEEKISL